MADNPFDTIIDSENKPQAANPFDSMISAEKDQQNSAMKQSMYVAEQHDPDEYANVVKLATKLGVEPAFIKKNYTDIAKQTTIDNTPYKEITDRSPSLAGFLSNPDNMSVARDDIHNLSKVEQGTRSVYDPKLKTSDMASDYGRAFMTGSNELNSAAYTLAVAYGLATPQEASEANSFFNSRASELQAQKPDYAKVYAEEMEKHKNDLNTAFGSFHDAWNEIWQGHVKNALKDYWKGYYNTPQEFAQSVATTILNPRGFAYQATESFLPSAPMLFGMGAGGAVGTGVGAAIGTLFGFPEAGGAIGLKVGQSIGGGLTQAPVEIANDINQSLIARGVDINNPEQLMAAYSDPQLMSSLRAKAEKKGLTSAFVNSLFIGMAGKYSAEAEGAPLMSKVLARIKGTGLQAAGQATGQLAGEAAAGETFQPGEAVQTGIETAAQSYLQEELGARLRKTFSPVPEKAAEQISNKAMMSEEAQHDVSALTQVGEAMKESKVAGRIPEKIQELLNTATEGNQAAKVFFQTDDWDKHWQDQGKSPVKAAEQILEDGGKAYSEAKETGAPMEIPIDQFVSKVGPHKDFEDLMPITRTRPDGMTLKEADEFQRGLPAMFKQVSDEAVKGSIEAPTTVDEGAKEIGRQVKEQLQATGASATDAAKQAEIWERGFRSLGERAGVDPQELFNRYQVKIGKELKGGGITYEQRAYAGSGAVFTKPSMDYIGTGQGAQAEGHGLYFTSRKDMAEAYRQHAIDEAKAKGEYRGGQIMAANIPEDHEMLDLNRKFSEQSPQVKEVIKEIGIDVSKDPTGKEIYNSLVEKTGGNVGRELTIEGQRGKGAQASKLLLDHGIKGNKYEIKDGHSYVVFDDKLVKPEQVYYQGQEGLPPRGRIMIGPNRELNIELLKDANQSTFLHETGHAFLEVMGDLAEKEGAPDALKKDYQTVLDWLGVKSRDEIGREQHEKWARGFETYLAEGKAPSSKLRESFARFKVWLTHIYGQMKNLGVELTPEVRNVMDRMLATDQEIRDAKEEQHIEPLFKNPSEYGFTDTTREKYERALAEADTAAKEQLDAKIMRNVSRERRAVLDEERAKIRPQIEETIDKRPEFTARRLIETEQVPKIDRDVVPKYLVDKVPKSVFARGDYYFEGRLHSEPGITPDAAAELLGFNNGMELLRGLSTTNEKEAIVKAITESELRKKYPDPFIQGQLPDEAMKALHNEKRSTLLRMELEHLASENMPALKEAIRRVARRVPTEEMVREQAERLVGTKPVEELNPRVYQLAEAKAAKEAGEALARGDVDGAFEAKRKELLNNELYKAVSDAKDKVESVQDFVKKVFGNDEKIAKSRDMNLVNAGRAVLSEFGLGKTDKTAEEYLLPLKNYDVSENGDTYNTIKALVDQAIDSSGDYKKISFNDFSTMHDTVKAMWDLARSSRQIEIEGKKHDIYQVIENHLIPRIEELGQKHAGRGYHEAISESDKRASKLLQANAWRRTAESWTNAMDGSTTGWFNKTITDPVFQAVDHYAERRNEVLTKVRDAVQEFVKGTTKEDYQKEIPAPEIGYTFGKDRRGQLELAMAILHTGNDSNFQKLLRGRKWGSLNEDGTLNSSKWDAFIARAKKESIIDKRYYDFAQKVWDLMDGMKGDLQKAHKQLYGYYFNEVTSKPFSNEFGDYKGGYMTARVDRLMVEDAAIRSEKEALENNSNSFAFPTSGRGATMNRIEGYAGPLDLNPAMILSHLDWATRFAYLEPTVRTVARVTMNPTFRKSLSGLDPEIARGMITPWLQRTVNQMTYKPDDSWGGSAFWRTARTRAVNNLMVANVTNTILRLHGLPPAAIKTGVGNMAASIATYMNHPFDMVKEIQEKSSYMKTRLSETGREMESDIHDLMVTPTKYEELANFTNLHGHFLQNAVHNVTDSVVWNAGYNKFKAEGLNEESAIREADKIVRATQGAHRPEDISRFEAGNHFEKMFTSLTSFFNKQANLMQTEFGNTIRDQGLKKGAGRLLYIYTLGVMIPGVLSKAVGNAMAGKTKDDNESYLQSAADTFFGGQADYIMAGVPIFGQLGHSFISGFNAFTGKKDHSYDDRMLSNPAFEMIKKSGKGLGQLPGDVYKAATGEGKKRRVIYDVTQALAPFSKVPLQPIARPLGYLADVQEGEAEPTGPLDFTRGLVTGKSAAQK